MNKQAELTRWTPRRLLSLLMALIMTLSLLPTAAFAADDSKDDSKLEFDSKKWSDTDKNQTLVTAEAEGGKVEVSLDNFDLTAEDLKPGASFTLPLKVDGTRPKDLKNYAYFVTIDGLSFGQTKLSQNFSYTHLFNLSVGQDDGLIHFTVTVTLYPNGRDAEPATSISQSVVMKTDYAERHYQIYYSDKGKTADGNDLPDGVTVTLSNCINGQTTTKVGSTVENGFLQEYKIPADATASAEGYTFRCWAPENAPWTKSGKTISHITGNRTLHPVFNNNGLSTDYTVAYDTADGNFPDGISFGNETATGTSYVIPEDAKSIKSGFAFTGWKVGDNTYAPGDTIKNINDSITLVAQYAQNFEITFESEYPNVSGLRKSAISTGTTYTVPNLPKMYGYTFKGWKVTFTGTDQVVNNQECVAPGMQITGITNNVTLTALWEDSDSSTSASSHTITFYENGTGVYNMPANQTVSNGKKATAPVVEPQRDGYTFSGWYTDAACTGAAYTFTEAVTADVALFAKWTAEQVTVTWPKDNDLTGVEFISYALLPTSVAKGSNISFRLKLEAGYDPATLHVYAGGVELGATATSSSGEYQYTLKDVQIDTTVTVSGPSKLKYTVTLPTGERFDAVFTDVENAIEGTDITASTKVVVEHGGSVKFTVTEREGWTIKNVYDNGTAMTKDADGKYAISGIQGDHQIEVNVEQTIFYNVTYAVPGFSSWTQSYQSGTKLGKTADTDNKITALATMTAPTGYTWDDNWYTDAECKTPITNANLLTVDRDVTVYAKFAPKKVTISYVSDGAPAKVGDTVISATQKTYGLGAQLTADIPTNAPGEGYTFLGWSENPSATAPAYKSGEMYNVDTEKDVTLYAVWEKQTFNISLSTGTGYSIHHTQPLQVEYGDTFSFRVAMSKGYSQNTPSVWLNWVENGQNRSQQLTSLNTTTDATTGLSVYHYTTPKIYWNATINVASAPDNVYTVTYKYTGLDGRTEYPKNEDTYLTQTVGWNATAQQPTVPSVDGYKFVGWYKTSDPTLTGDNPTAPYDFTASVTSNLTIYAVFSAVQPTITRTNALKGNGWSTSDWKWANNPVTTNDNFFLVDYGSDVEFTLNIEEGYDASGVTVSVNGKLLQPYGDATVAGNVTKITYKLTNVTEDSEIVVGGVTRKEVKITYYANATDDVGHFPGQQTVKYYINGKADNGTLDPAKPTRVGYEFKGWSTDPETDPDKQGVKLYQPGGAHDFVTDTNLYAIWKATSTTVTLAVDKTAQYEGKDITLTAEIAKASGLGTPGGSMRFYKKTIDGTTVLIETVPVTGEKVTLPTAVGEFINKSDWTEQYWVEYFPEEGKGFATSTSNMVDVSVWSTAISWRISGASIIDGGDVLTVYENARVGNDNTKGAKVADGKMIAGNVYWLEIPEVLALNGGNDPTIGHGYEIRWQYMDDSGSWQDFRTVKDSNMVMIDADHSRYSFRANVVPTDPFTKAVDYDENGKLIDNKYNNAGLYTKQTKYVALQATTTTLAVAGADDEENTVYINGTQPFGTVGPHLAQFEGEKVTLTATVVDASKAAVTDGYVNFYKNDETTPMNEQPIAVGQNGTATYQATTSAFSGNAIDAKDTYYAVYLTNDTYSTSDSQTALRTVYIKSTEIAQPVLESELAGKRGGAAANTTAGDDLTELLAGVQHTFSLVETGAQTKVEGVDGQFSVVAKDGRTVDANNYTVEWLKTTGSNEQKLDVAKNAKIVKVDDNKFGDKYRVKLIPQNDMKVGEVSNYAVIGTKQNVKVTVSASADWVYQRNEITLTAEVAAAGEKPTMQPAAGDAVSFYYQDGDAWVKLGSATLTKDSNQSGKMLASITTKELAVTAATNVKRNVVITAVYEGNDTFNKSATVANLTDKTCEITPTDGCNTTNKTVAVYSSVVYVNAGVENKNVLGDKTNESGIYIYTENDQVLTNDENLTLMLSDIYTLDYGTDAGTKDARGKAFLTFNTDYTVEWQELESAAAYSDKLNDKETPWKSIGSGQACQIRVTQGAAYRAKITVSNTDKVQASYTNFQQDDHPGRNVYYSNILMAASAPAGLTVNVNTSNTSKGYEGIVEGETVTIHTFTSGATGTTPISELTVEVFAGKTIESDATPVFKETRTDVNGHVSFDWSNGVTPGYYTLRVRAKFTNGYLDQVITRELIVRDKSYTFAADTVQSKVYNGKAQGIDWTLTGVDIENALAQKSAVVYYYDESDKMVEPTQVGKYTYKLYLPASAYWTGADYRADDANYPDYVTGTFEITQRKLEVADLVAQTKVYDGTTTIDELEIILKDAAVDANGTATGDSGLINGDSVYATGTMTIGEPNAGVQELSVSDVKLVGADAKNYKVDDSSYKEKINVQRSQVKGSIIDSSYLYTGKNITIEKNDQNVYLIDQAGTRLTPDQYTITYYYHNGDAVEQVPAMNKLGKYTVIARPVQNNYKGGAEQTVYVVSDNATVGTLNTSARSALLHISDTVKVYDGQATGVTVTATKGTATASYYYNDGTSTDWHTTAPTNAGRYLVKATVTNDSVTDTAYGIYTIVKALPKLELTAVSTDYTSGPIASVASATYNGTPIAEVLTEGVDYYYTYTGGTIQGIAYEAPTEAGDYVVTLHVNEKDGNYTAHEVSANFTINRIDLTIQPDSASRQQYGAYPALTAGFTGLATGGVAKDTSLRDVQIQPELIFDTGYTNDADDQSGNQYGLTAAAALARNYNVSYQPGNLSVTPTDPQSSLEIRGMIENGNGATDLAYYGDKIQLYAYGNQGSLVNGGGTAVNTSSTLKWSSSDPSVANINEQTGLMEIVGVGTATITLTRGYGATQIYTALTFKAKKQEVKVVVPSAEKVYKATEQHSGQTRYAVDAKQETVTDITVDGIARANHGRTVIGSQIVTAEVKSNVALYQSETYGGLFTINDWDVTIKPTEASTIYGTPVTGLIYTEVTPAGSDKVLTDDKAVSVADIYGNLDVYDGYEILVAGTENLNYNVHYQTKNDQETVDDVKVTAKSLTVSTGALNEQIGMTSGSLNPAGKYPVDGAEVESTVAMGSANVRMYGEPNWVMDYELTKLISGDTLADLTDLTGKLVNFNYNIGADANVSYSDKATKLKENNGAGTNDLPDYIIETDDNMIAFRNYTENYSKGSQNVYQRPVTLKLREGLTNLTAYAPEILSGSDVTEAGKAKLLELLLNNLVVEKYKNGTLEEGGLAELLKHTIEDLDIQIDTITNANGKLTLKLKLGNQNYWLDPASSMIDIDLVSTKIVPVYSPLDWTSFTVTMYNETKTTPVAVSGNVRFFIFQKKDDVELKYSNYKNDTIIRSGLMDPTGRTGEFRATFSRLPAGDYAIFAIAENYTIVE